ncbi:MAG: hypothetical protein ACPGVO_00550 [Spirulinaceae cyanobacterium]
MSKTPRQYLPEAIAIFWVTFFFVLSSLHPYHVNGDVGLIIKSVQQFVDNKSPFLQIISSPNPNDLTQNIETWIAWFPPGIAIAFYPLMAIGLPIAIATKLTAYGLIMSGCLGWLQLGKRFRLPTLALVIAACTLPLYSLTVSGAIKLESGDILPFSIVPWLYIYAFELGQNYLPKTHRSNSVLYWRCCGLGLLLGSIYWLKYSAFLAACSVSFYLFFEIVWGTGQANLTTLEKIKLLLIGAIAFAIAPLMLSLINQHFTQTVNYVEQINQSKDLVSPNHPMGGWTPIFFLAAPGVAAFQFSLFLKHFIFYSDSWLPFFRDLEPKQRTIPLGIACLPISALVLALVYQVRKICTSSVWIFSLCVGFLPFFPLVYLSHSLDLNFLVMEPRYAMSHFIVVELLCLKWLVSQLSFASQRIDFTAKRIRALIILLVLVVLPSLFHGGYFLKEQIWDRRQIPHYTTTAKDLYVPSFSRVNSRAIVQAITQTQKSAQDVVVLALLSPADAWLEIDQRPLVLSYGLDGVFTHTHDVGVLNIKSTQPFRTAKPLRVTLVVARELIDEPNLLSQLQNRFPQATAWHPVTDIELDIAEVGIYYADLY